MQIPRCPHRAIGQYLRENFYITTSGNFRTQTLTEVMLEVGPHASCTLLTILSKTSRSQQTGSTTLLSAMRTA